MNLYVMVGLIIASVSAFAFEKKPWLGEFLEFQFTPSFTYRHYPSVEGGYDPTSYSSNDRFTNLDLSFALEPWEAEVCVEIADTRRQCLGTQSSGIQVRYQWMNDIVGDVLSWTLGLNARWASRRSLKDVSCPYHAEWNFEIGNSLGKEISLGQSSFFNPYVFLGIGQANKGRPWIRGLIGLQAVFQEKHQVTLLGDGYFGLGQSRSVNVRDFSGYANIFHQSIDIGLQYDYKISKAWGEVSLFYSYRVFAKNFPEYANTFYIAYNFPFSFS